MQTSYLWIIQQIVQGIDTRCIKALLVDSTWNRGIVAVDSLVRGANALHVSVAARQAVCLFCSANHELETTIECHEPLTIHGHAHNYGRMRSGHSLENITLKLKVKSDSRVKCHYPRN